MKYIYAIIAIFIINQNCFATTWHSDPSGGLANVLSNWWSNADGTGVHPTAFTTAGDTFMMQSNMTGPGTGSNWTLGTYPNTNTLSIVAGIFTANFDTLKIGNFLMSSSAHFSRNSDIYNTHVFIYGNLSVSGSATFFNPIAWNYLHLANTASSATSPQAISFSTTGIGNYTYLIVDTGVTASLSTNSIYSQGDPINVKGSLNCYGYTLSGTGGFILDSNATIVTQHPNGINGSITMTGSAYLSFSHSAKYIFNGSSVQHTGSYLPSLFENQGTLTINNAGGVVLTNSTHFSAGSILDMTYGNLILNSDTLTLGIASTLFGTFGTTTKFITTHNGLLNREISGSGSYTYYLGDTAGNYLPVALNVSGSSYPAGASMSVGEFDIKHPSNSNTNNFLYRYWHLSSSGMSAESVSFSASYLPADVAGSNADLAIGRFSGSLHWTRLGAPDTLTETIYVSPLIDSNIDFTCISKVMPSFSLVHDTFVCQGSSVTLAPASVMADSPFSFAWAPPIGLSSTTGNMVSANPSSTTTYTLTLTDGNGFTFADTVRVVPHLLPIVTVPNDTSFCAGYPVAGLNFNSSLPSTTYSWTNSNNLIGLSSAGTGFIPPFTIANPDTIPISSTIVVTPTAAGCIGVPDSFHITVTLYPLAFTGSITGDSLICPGTTAMYIDTAPGGSWSVSNANAFISGSGALYAIHAGLDTVFFSVTNSCGVNTAKKIITIHPLPVAGAISGTDNVCTGENTVLTDSLSGGLWSTTNTNVSISGGVAHGVSVGMDTVLYVVTNYCGSDTAIFALNVLTTPSAGTIVGTSSLCQGSEATFTDLAFGGIWSVSGSHLVINSVGTGYALSAGTDTIHYSVSNSCGSNVANKVVTVNPLPSAGAIIGVAELCAAATTTFTNTVAGGNWSLTNANATNIGGIVTGVHAGVDSIKYLVTSVCGADSVYHSFTVLPLPVADSIFGPDSVCVGSEIHLFDSSLGGVWSERTSKTIVSASGWALGLSTGIDSIFYSVTNSCGTSATSKVIAILPLPNAGFIMGTDKVCIGNKITLTDSVTGGFWSNIGIHTADSLGNIKGMSVGRDTIIYTVSNYCGSASVKKIVQVLPLPKVDKIIAADSVCTGASTTLIDSIPGGAWSCSPSNLIVSGNSFYALHAGIDTIRYTISGYCGIADTFLPVMIFAPLMPQITGTSFLCLGAGYTHDSVVSYDTAFLSGFPAGGNWHATNNILSVNNGMIVSSSAGFDTVVYTVHNTCGIYSDSVGIRVYSKMQCDSIFNDFVAIDALENQISLYPNPNNGFFVIKTPETLHINEIRVFDRVGNCIQSFAPKIGKTTEIDLSGRPLGIYFIQLNGKSGLYRLKAEVF